MRKLLPGGMLTVVLLLAMISADGHRTSVAATPSVAGLWLGTVYYGDPADPATPTERFTATLHRDGTYMVNSTAATGMHPANPGAKTPD